MKRGKKPWAAIEDDILRRLFLTAPTEQVLAALPGRTLKAMYGRAHVLKIRRRCPASRNNRLPIHPVIIGLRAAREAIDMSRRQAAMTAGYAEISLLRWELGQAQPPLACVVDWAGALGFDLVLRKRESNADVIPFPEKRRLMAGR